MGKHTGTIIHGCVEAVLINDRSNEHPATPVDKIACVLGHGIKNDRHAGVRLADVREAEIPDFGLSKGLQIANHREVSLVSMEELEEIRNGLHLPSPLPFGTLCENIVVSDIPHFSQIPSGSLFFFTHSSGVKRVASIAVWRQNVSCHIPITLIQQVFPNLPPNTVKQFPVVASDIRGLVGSVYCSGFIHKGDRVTVYIPKQTPYPPV